MPYGTRRCLVSGWKVTGYAGLLHRLAHVSVIGFAVLLSGSCSVRGAIGDLEEPSASAIPPVVESAGQTFSSTTVKRPEVSAHAVDYLDHLPKGDAQRELTCSLGNRDPFSQWYCAGPTAPTITSLEDVLVGLDLKQRGSVSGMFFAVNGHSSSLVMRRTTSINPRVVFFSSQEEPNYRAAGFVRGDFMVEVLGYDAMKDDINFYLLRYEKECEPNCGNADRFLEQTESGWRRVSAYEVRFIHQTSLDCLACHQPEGQGSRRILRMQELVSPWTHWFRRGVGGSTNLFEDFYQTHCEDPKVGACNQKYATIPIEFIENSEPAALEKFVCRGQVGFSPFCSFPQPNLYEGMNINADDPSIDIPNSDWLQLFDGALRGEMIPPPHYSINPFDSDKIALAKRKYRAVAFGGADPELLPDMTDLFKDEELGHLSFKPAARLSAKEIVEHRCMICHDDRFPTKNSFRAADFPGQLTAEMKAKITYRINLPDAHRWRMPPKMIADLTSAEKRLIELALE